MAGYPNRLSSYSNLSASTPRPVNPASQQVSTTTLLNALHTSYASGQPYPLEVSTSLAVNTWVTAANVGPDGRFGGTVDTEIAKKAWEHARRRAEDGCIILGSLHESTPSLFAPFCSALPFSIPGSFYTALNVIKAFTHCVTPQNPSAPRYSSLSATFTLALTGDLTAVNLALSTSGLDTNRGLLNIPAQAGYRAFDVFYYLITSSASPAEREFLNLKPPSSYSLLNKSGTFNPPSFLVNEDDAASAEDFRENLRAIGIKGPALRSLISTLAGLLKLGDTLGFLVDEDVLNEVCEDVAVLLDVDASLLRQKVDTLEREVLIGGLYESLVDWVIARANATFRNELRGIKAGFSSDSENGHSGAVTPRSSVDDGDSVSITVIEIAGQELGKAVALRTVFDDSTGINAEMKEDGVPFEPAGSSVLREMNTAVAACEPELGIMTGAAGREYEQERDRREALLEKVDHEIGDDNFLKELLHPIDGEGILLGKAGRFDLSTVISSCRVWFHLSLHPTDESPATLSAATPASGWSAGSVSRQLRSWRLPEWANRRNKRLDFTADFDVEEFVTRYGRLGCQDGKDGVESFMMSRGWSNGDLVIGHERIWIRENAWWEAETMLEMKVDEGDSPGMLGGMGLESGYSVQSPGLGSGFFGPQYGDNMTLAGSRDNLLQRHYSSATGGARSVHGARSLAPTAMQTARSINGGDYGLGNKGDDRKDGVTYYGDFDPELGDSKVVVEQPITASRRAWVAFVWALTFWIPSPVLKYVGRMKRPDVRMAWREKLVLVLLIFLLNAIVVFYIVEFGRLLCPNWDKAWNAKEVSYHQGNDDFWVSHRGKVYDISKFWKIQHSDTSIETTAENMQPFAGTNLDSYIAPPLTIACPHLVSDPYVQLLQNETNQPTNPNGLHVSGPTFQPDPNTKLHNINWYTQNFLPKMKEYYKGDLVVDANVVKSEGQNLGHNWVIINNNIYDLTDYMYTQQRYKNVANYSFMASEVVDLVRNNPGEDITKEWYERLNASTNGAHLQCFNNYFYVGKTDFRKTAKCQVNNYILLAFTIILCSVILIKFLAALQLGGKRRPAPQDKFVICQVPAYTEGEDQLRKGLDSLTSLAYDNKRKLICVICDGMIVGGGNDRPTPKIVLDILGVDPKIDPPALPFRSVGQGSEQLNYGKVYSGLYEYEGNVVPYLVVVKVGKESEQSKAKPGNRGKRDSQILLMSFLNRVHHRAPMSPLELEMFHQINNVIGVDPELYEYLLMVDADTMVKEDALTRLVAACSNDAKIAGICGETSLENEERSWWTMIQVYEYYISHHLAKAFESLFGSVTCLPGCFCMYRLRTADKGRPLIISDRVIEEYADCNIDTLHKKNLLSLGEDRYLTTLMTKHFPAMSYKFVPDAYALTAAPEKWSVLLSQRRRWINSTIHNLAELVFLKDMCGFCCFSMRFVVFIDLFGTIILPATCAYLGYLLYRVGSHTGQFPLISIIMIAAVYGLQAVIFIIKRQWQHIGWMIIYILAFPVYSFVLPIYSFWKQDDFSWGNTRIVIGEKGNKQVVALDDEGFDPRSIPLQRWDDYALANNLPGRRGLAHPTEKGGAVVAGGYGGSAYDDNGYEMDDMQSVYSSVKPASTILTGFPQFGSHIPPAQSPSPYAAMQHRQSGYSNFSGTYGDGPLAAGAGAGGGHERLMSMGGMSDQYAPPPLYAHNNASTLSRPGMPGHFPSSSDLLNPQARTTSPSQLHPYGGGYAQQQRARSPLGAGFGGQSRPVSMANFQTGQAGPSDAQIVEAVRECLREVDMDSVTKKQVKALVEQRLQTSLGGERRVFLDQMIDFELANM